MHLKYFVQLNCSLAINHRNAILISLKKYLNLTSSDEKMKNKINASNPLKSKSLVVLELFLLILCLCLIALRTTLTEILYPQSTDKISALDTIIYSLILSSILIVTFISWLIFNFFTKRFLYRSTGIETGLLLLVIASVISSLAASNTRAAITSAVIFIAPLLMAVLLIQILDSSFKIKLTLAVIAASGFLCTYQCFEQFYDSNEKLIEQYKEKPIQMLQSLGIQPSSLEHFQFEHRLYSKDIKGFFTTSNSAGSFIILALFAAAVLFIDKTKNRKHPESDPWHYLTSGTVLIIVVIGLLLTRSKGAILAVLLALALFASLWFLGSWIYSHKKIILIICLLLIASATWITFSYGLTHNRLPGGNSMLVRWQYWLAASKIATVHPYTGVGPANFATAYLRYKVPQAIETISDPHNFILSLLTQYGPIGLMAFLAIICLPLWKINPVTTLSETPVKTHAFKTLKILLMVFIPLVLLIFRPLLMPFQNNLSIWEIATGVIQIFILPIATFIIGFFLITYGPVYDTQDTKRKMNITIAALVCAVFGLLIHNLIDFAIFEPSVFTAFCAILACLIASDLNMRRKPFLHLRANSIINIITALIGFTAIFALLYYCIIPVVKSSSKINAAIKAEAIGSYQQAHILFTEAAEVDPLSTMAPYLNGQLYKHHYVSNPGSVTELLIQAENCYMTAIKRNPNKFNYFEQLSDIYLLLSQVQLEPQKTEWLNKAFDAKAKAVELYPGLARLHLSLAQIAEQLGKKNLALEHYEKAIEIEDSFREQFKLMYPDRPIFSRLGQQNYEITLQKIKNLKN